MLKRLKLNYYIELWLMHKKILVKESTFSRYNEIINLYVRPYFGNVYINSINDKLVINFLNSLYMQGRLSNKTIRDIFTLIRQVFKFSNINVNIQLPKKEKSTIKILSKEEQLLLEKYVCSHLNFYNIGILLSLYTGIRLGELCSLQWKNIDLVKREIIVSNTMLRIKNLDGNSKKTKIIIDTPKSSSSNRIIPISSGIYKLLVQLKKYVKNENNYLLTNSLKYIEPRAYYYNYKKIMKKINLGDYNFHALRHTFATRCIELGFDYKTLSEILGHSDIKMTLTFYVHPTQKLKIANMEKLKFL